MRSSQAKRQQLSRLTAPGNTTDTEGQAAAGPLRRGLIPPPRSRAGGASTMRSGDAGEAARVGAGTTVTPRAAIFRPTVGDRLGFEWPPRGSMGVVVGLCGAASGGAGAVLGDGERDVRPAVRPALPCPAPAGGGAAGSPVLGCGARRHRFPRCSWPRLGSRAGRKRRGRCRGARWC